MYPKCWGLREGCVGHRGVKSEVPHVPALFVCVAGAEMPLGPVHSAWPIRHFLKPPFGALYSIKTFARRD